MNCSPPDSSVSGIFQAGILEWVEIPLLPFLLQGSSQSRDQTCVSCITGRFFTTEPHDQHHSFIETPGFLFRAPAWWPLGMTVMQNLSYVLWWVPQMKDLYPKSLFICTWVKMTGRPFFCPPFISNTRERVKCHRGTTEADRDTMI